MWTQANLALSPEQELKIACSTKFSADARYAAWKRYEAKKWYATLCLDGKGLDLPDLDPLVAAEVSHLRNELMNTKVPDWVLVPPKSLPDPVKDWDSRADMPDEERAIKWEKPLRKGMDVKVPDSMEPPPATRIIIIEGVDPNTPEPPWW